MLLAAPLALAQPATQPTPPTWELKGEGRWQPADPAAAPVVQEPTLDRVEEMIRNRQGSSAKRIVVAWLRSHKDHPARDRGIFLLGQANYAIGGGNRTKAFYNFDELLDKYPDSRYFYPALQRQYDIADAYLRGYRTYFLGLPVFGAEDQATEMLWRIQQRAPGSPLAEKSLLRVADYYYSDAQFDIAADAYAAYIRNYPRSPLVSRVRLRQAFSALAQFRGIHFDATPVIDARQQLVNVAADFPEIAEQENVSALLSRIDEALAKKLLATADFYRRTGKETSAVYQWRYLIEQFPNSPEAAEAQRRLDRVPPDVLEKTVAPRPAPATNPVAPETRRSR